MFEIYNFYTKGWFSSLNSQRMTASAIREKNYMFILHLNW